MFNNESKQKEQLLNIYNKQTFSLCLLVHIGKPYIRQQKKTIIMQQHDWLTSQNNQRVTSNIVLIEVFKMRKKI